MKRALIIAALLACFCRAQDAGVWWQALAADGWTPAQLGSKLAVWFDAADNATVLDDAGNVATNGASVQTWQDKSGYGRHATAPAAAQRPRYRTAVQNGRAVMRTGGDDQLNIGSAGGVFRNKTAGYTVAVAKDAAQTGGDGNHMFVGFTRNSAGSSRATLSGRSAALAWVGVGRRLDTDPPVAAGQSAAAGHQLLRVFHDWSNGNVRLSVGGGVYASTAYIGGAGASSDTDSTQVSMFRYEETTECPENSEIAEVVVVNAAMTSGEIAALENYLKTKWGTP